MTSHLSLAHHHGLRPSDLNVVAVISNPMRYESRSRLFRDFIHRMEAAGVTLWIVEAAFGERDFEIDQGDHARHIRVRCDQPVWVKEAMINIGVAALTAADPGWRYLMWCDGDVMFVNPNWVMDILHGLQHYPVLQPFSHAIDLGPDGESLEGAGNVKQGFGFCYEQGMVLGEKYGPYFFPGYAWAWTRWAWDTVGGMIDLAVAGSGDDHMAKSMIGKADRSLPKGLHPNYNHMVKAWEAKAKAFHGNIGYVPGMILHNFHGFKQDRQYNSRWQMLIDHQYDPYSHISRNAHGLPTLIPEKTALLVELRRYLRSRREDHIVRQGSTEHLTSWAGLKAAPSKA